MVLRVSLTDKQKRIPLYSGANMNILVLINIRIINISNSLKVFFPNFLIKWTLNDRKFQHQHQTGNFSHSILAIDNFFYVVCFFSKTSLCFKSNYAQRRVYIC